MNAAVFVDFENLYLSPKSRNDGTGVRTRELSLQILEGMLARLRKKVEVSPDEPVHVVTVHGIGYRFESQEVQG